MSSDVFERLRDYFQAIADSLEDQKKASRIFPNAVDAGATREDLLLELLKRHIPNRCDVIRGGFVFDSKGNESRQLDLIITNDFTLNFKHFAEKAFAPIEGCTAVISIKSYLSKAELFDALDGLHSMPPMPPLAINPQATNIKRLGQLPLKNIFAFDGSSPKAAG